MFVILDSKGKELDRWQTKELALESARSFLGKGERAPLVIWEVEQATGKRKRIQTLRKEK